MKNYFNTLTNYGTDFGIEYPIDKTKRKYNEKGDKYEKKSYCTFKSGVNISEFKVEGIFDGVIVYTRNGEYFDCLNYSTESFNIDSVVVDDDFDNMDEKKALQIFKKQLFNVNENETIEILNNYYSTLRNDINDIYSDDSDDSSVSGNSGVSSNTDISSNSNDFNNSNDYVIVKKLPDTDEIEYAICTENGFILKQCNLDCVCHDVVKNQRPKTVELCNPDSEEGPAICLIDGEKKNVERNDYLGMEHEMIVNGQYITTYMCYGVEYERGNYSGASSILIGSMVLILFAFLF